MVSRLRGNDSVEVQGLLRLAIPDRLRRRDDIRMVSVAEFEPAAPTSQTWSTTSRHRSGHATADQYIALLLISLNAGVHRGAPHRVMPLRHRPLLHRRGDRRVDDL